MELSNNLEKTIERYDSGENVDFIIFFSHRPNKKGTASRNCLSNFYIAPFTIDGITFICNEQWMMNNKAMVFGDKEIASRFTLCYYYRRFDLRNDGSGNLYHFPRTKFL